MCVCVCVIYAVVVVVVVVVKKVRGDEIRIVAFWGFFAPANEKDFIFLLAATLKKKQQEKREICVLIENLFSFNNTLIISFLLNSRRNEGRKAGEIGREL